MYIRVNYLNIKFYYTHLAVLLNRYISGQIVKKQCFYLQGLHNFAMKETTLRRLKNVFLHISLSNVLLCTPPTLLHALAMTYSLWSSCELHYNTVTSKSCMPSEIKSHKGTHIS